MGMYRTEWECCGDTTETDAWIPDACPFCSVIALKAERDALREQVERMVEWARGRCECCEHWADERDEYGNPTHYCLIYKKGCNWQPPAEWGVACAL